MTAPPNAAAPIAGARKLLVVMSDLLFRSKIDEVARRLGLELRVAKSPEQLDRQLAAGEPALAIVDLEESALDSVRGDRAHSGGLAERADSRLRGARQRRGDQARARRRRDRARALRIHRSAARAAHAGRRSGASPRGGITVWGGLCGCYA